MSDQPTRKQRREQARAERLAAERAAAEAAARRRRLAILGGIAAAAVVAIVVAIAVASSGGKHTSTTASGPDPRITAMFAGIPEQGITLGKPSAPVTLVEFSDLKCPICKQFSAAILPTVVRDYVRTGKVKLVFRNLTFVGEQLNPGDSPAAARMAGAAGLQNRLWPFAETFYANQQDETTRYVTDDFLRSVGQQTAGLNVNQALAQRSSPAVAAQLAAAQSLANQYGVDSTPTFLIGSAGRPLRRVQAELSVDFFRSLLDGQLRSS